MADYSRTRRNTGEGESDSFFCRFTFGQFFALLVLEVFTLFFVFYLGARYGREFLGLDKKPAVAVVESGTPAKRLAVQTTDDPEAREIAHDLIAKAQTPELKERIASMLNKDEDATQPAMPTPHPMATAPEQPAPATPEEPAERSGGMPMRSPSEVAEQPQADVIRVKSAENARYSIQVGSYQNVGEANGMVDRWKARGYPAYVMIADIPNRGRWYRVRIGGFASRGDASRYLAKLRVKENVRDALIVLNEQ